MFSTHVVSPSHGTGSRWCGEAGGGYGDDDPFLLALRIRVFYTYMVFFIPFPSRTSYPLFSSYFSFPSSTRVCVFLCAHALRRIQRIPLRGKMK